MKTVKRLIVAHLKVSSHHLFSGSTVKTDTASELYKAYSGMKKVN